MSMRYQNSRPGFTPPGSTSTIAKQSLRHVPIGSTTTVERTRPQDEKGRQIFRVQLVSPLLVGGEAIANMLFTDRRLDDPMDDNKRHMTTSEKSVTVSDALFQNAGFPGDWFDVEWRPDLKIFQPVGSKGLTRTAKLLTSTEGLFNRIVPIEFYRRLGAGIYESLGVNTNGSFDWLFNMFGGKDFPVGTNVIVQWFQDAKPGSVSAHSGRWEIIQVDDGTASEIKLARVYEPSSKYIDHNDNGTVQFLEQQDGGDCGDLEPNGTPEEVTVCNALGVRVWHGAEVAIVPITPPNESGYSGDSTKWYILEAYSATRIRGQLTAALWPFDSSGSLDNCVGMNGHFYADPGDSITVDNSKFKLWGCDNAWAEAAWDEDSDSWQLVTLPPPTQVRGHATAGVSVCGDESPPTTITIQSSTLAIYGIGCVPDQTDIVITNPLALPFQSGDVLQLDIDISADPLAARITNVVHVIQDVVTEVTDPGSGNITVNCTRVSTPDTTTCGVPACADIVTEDCP